MTVPILDKRKLVWVPFVLLLLSLSTVFLFGNDRGCFYRVGHHNAVTSNYMVVVANLSFEHNFVRFHYQTLDADGTITYDVYHRFPIGGYILLKLAILPFGDDFSAQIYAARMAMLLFFVATAVLAYLSLCRLTPNRWIALAATLLAFSSFYCLHYNDMVATENGIDFFGVMLTFHGLVIFCQEGRFRQLLVRTCIALLLGWHVFALLLPFIVFNLVRELNHACNNSGRLVVALLRSRSLTLGIVALLFGLSVLSLNFAQEYIALKGETSLTNLPSFSSMKYRTGYDAPGWYDRYPHHLAWVPYMEMQFSRLGGMLLPYYLIGLGWASVVEWPWTMAELPGIFIVGIGACGVCLIGLVFVRHKLLLATLAMSGFCWTLPMRYSVAFHDYESLSYMGIPLVGFTLALLGIHKLLGARLVVGLAIAALLVFVLSNLQMGKVGQGVQATEFHKKMMADFDVIRNITKGKVVFVPQSQYDENFVPQYDENAKFSGARQSTSYYLVGSIILYKDILYKDSKRYDKADFVITRERDQGTASLTPENQLAFLYDRAAYDTQQAYRIDSVFDVYRHKDKLVYLKEPCTPDDTEEGFYLHFIPVDEDDLPANRKQYGFDNYDFVFSQYGMHFDGKCMASVPLPQYEIARIRTGQYIFDRQQRYISSWNDEAVIRVGNGPKRGVVTRIMSPPIPPRFHWTHRGNGEVALRWRIADSDLGTIEKHQYRYSTDRGATWSIWTDIAGAGNRKVGRLFHYLVTGLTNGTEYTIQVRAENQAGTSGPAVSKSVTPRAVPKMVRNFAVQAGNGQATLTWANPNDTTITKYRYDTRHPRSAGGWTGARDIPGSNASMTSFTVTGLTNDSLYVFTMRAVNHLGPSPQTRRIDVIPTANK